MPLLKEQLSVVDEAYLVGLSNRGIVNRSQKELAQAQPTITLTDSALKAEFADGILVEINETLTNYACTCPSRTLCKHVIMAVLQASRTIEQDQKDSLNLESAQESAVSFEYLLTYTPERLAKEFGKTAYNDSAFKIMQGESCTLEEGSLLVIKVMEEMFTVRFLPDSTVSESVCTCKAKSCRHRLEAIMHYIRHKKETAEFKLIVEEADLNLEIIPYISRFIEDIFHMGLFRLPSDYAEKCAQFAVLCHGAGFAVFERLFDACSRELNLYEQKNAAFHKTALIQNLARIYQVCGAILSGQEAGSLAGRLKRSYWELPQIRILGLGAYAWYTKSGFCGVTAVFFCPDLKKTLTFASSRPVSSEQEGLREITQMRHSKAAWNLPLSFEALAGAELSLTGAKASDNSRLSSSDKTRATLMNPQTCLDAEELAPVVFEDFTGVKTLFSADPESPRMVYAVLKISRIDKGVFDKVTQTYRAGIIDRFNNSLSLKIGYSQINEPLIRAFELLTETGVIPDAVTVSISVADESQEASVFPVSLWLGDIKTFSDKMVMKEKQDKGVSEFSKFFKEEDA